MQGENFSKKQRIARVAGICGVLIPIVIFTSLILAMYGSPWFTWANNALSDLGVQGISAFFFNNGVILGGLLLLIFSIGLSKILKKKTGPYMLAVSALALIGVGLFPKTVFLLHYISSATFFILVPLTLFIFAITLKENRFDQSMGALALIFAIFALSSPVFLQFLQGIAIPEAIVCFPAFLWCMVYGTKMALLPA